MATDRQAALASECLDCHGVYRLADGEGPSGISHGFCDRCVTAARSRVRKELSS